MKTANWALIFILTLSSACHFAGGKAEAQISSADAPSSPAPLPDAAESHVAVTFLIGEGRTDIRNVKVGKGPSRSYARENKPIKIELLDRNRKPFDQIVIDDPRQLRVYHGSAASESTPHGVVTLQEAEATIVLPLDPRLNAILVIVDVRDRGRPLAIRDAVAEQCERDESDACHAFLRGR